MSFQRDSRFCGRPMRVDSEVSEYASGRVPNAMKFLGIRPYGSKTDSGRKMFHHNSTPMFRVHGKRAWQKWLRAFNAVVILSMTFQPVGPAIILAQSADDAEEVAIEEPVEEADESEEEDVVTEEDDASEEAAEESEESTDDEASEETSEEESNEETATDGDQATDEAPVEGSDEGVAEESSEAAPADDVLESEDSEEDTTGEASVEESEDNSNIPNEPTVEAEGPAFDERDAEPESSETAEPVEEVSEEDAVLAEWMANAKDDGYMIVEVAEGGTYWYGHDGFQITFTRIDGDIAEASRLIGIKAVELSSEQQEALGALSDTAYDVISPMETGAFEYELTLPTPDDVDEDSVSVAYVENEDDLDDPKKMETVDADDVSVDTDKKEAKVKDLDHFTVWFPVIVIEEDDLSFLKDPVTINGGTSVLVLPGTMLGVEAYARVSFRSSWKSTAYKVGDGSWECVNHPNHSAGWSLIKDFTENFNILAPNTAGTYDLSVRLFSHNNSCVGSVDDSITLDDAITVVGVPEAPTGMRILNASGDDIGCGGYVNERSITVDWDDSADTYFAHYDYQIREETTIATPITSELSGDIRDEDGHYKYRVRTVDTFEQTSDWTEWCGVTLDREAPDQVSITTPSDGEYFTSSPISNEWTAVSDNGVSGVATYRVWYAYDDDHGFGGSTCGVLNIGSKEGRCRDVAAPGTSRNHTPGIGEQGGVTIRVQAIDHAGNEGAWSDPVHYVYDATPPAMPTGLRRIAPDEDNKEYACGAVSKIQRMWPDWDDNTEADFSHYEYSSFNPTSQGIDEQRFDDSIFEYNGSWMPGEGTYGFAVRAVDKAGNKSAWALSGETLEGSCQITYDSTAPAVANNESDGIAPYWECGSSRNGDGRAPASLLVADQEGRLRASRLWHRKRGRELHRPIARDTLR